MLLIGSSMALIPLAAHSSYLDARSFSCLSRLVHFSCRLRVVTTNFDASDPNSFSRTNRSVFHWSVWFWPMIDNIRTQSAGITSFKGAEADAKVSNSPLVLSLMSAGVLTHLIVTPSSPRDDHKSLSSTDSVLGESVMISVMIDEVSSDSLFSFPGEGGRDEAADRAAWFTLMLCSRLKRLHLAES